jgi:CheY-like chemotaxis protein
LQAPARAFAPSDAKRGELRVLAAEDNKTNQLVLTTLLQQMGVTPMIVEDGALAVEAWQTGQFDLILMDMQMPVMDGLTAGPPKRSPRAPGRPSSP